MSASVMRQSAMRLSITSMQASTPAIAASASWRLLPARQDRAKNEADLGLDLRLEQAIERDVGTVFDEHVVEQDAEVGLVDAERRCIAADVSPTLRPRTTRPARRRRSITAACTA